jgi:hypothetical protein
MVKTQKKLPKNIIDGMTFRATLYVRGVKTHISGVVTENTYSRGTNIHMVKFMITESTNQEKYSPGVIYERRAKFLYKEIKEWAYLDYTRATKQKNELKRKLENENSKANGE